MTSMHQDLPISLADLTEFEPTKQDAMAASELVAELTTRIATRELHPRSGDEVAAAESMAKLVSKVRELLVRFPKARRFELVGVALLDYVICPRTSRWHRQIKCEQFTSSEICKRFRTELAVVQKCLVRAVRLLRILKKGGDPVQDDLWLGPGVLPAGRPRVRSVEMHNPITARIHSTTTTSSCQTVDVGAVFEAEKAEIKRRRGLKEKGELVDMAGLALSGGGIRSATFALGVLEELSKRGLFSQFHYMSTVSGGGYLGTFLTSYLNDAGAGPVDDVLVAGDDDSCDSAAVRHLRNRSRYLSEGGIAGWIRAAATIFFGAISNLFALAPYIGIAALATISFKEGGFWGGEAQWKAPAPIWNLPPASWASRIAVALVVVMVFYHVLAKPLARYIELVRSKPDARTHSVPAWLVWLRMGAFAAVPMVAIALIPHLFRLYQSTSLVNGGEPAGTAGSAGGFPWSVVISGALMPIAGKLASWFRGAGWGTVAIRVVFTLSGYLFFLLLYLAIGTLLMDHGSRWIYVLTGAVLLVHAVVMNLNDLSPHRLYRDLLARCYLVKIGVQGAVTKRERLDLSKVDPPDKENTPYPLVNATLNVPKSRSDELRGRGSDFFLFSPKFCGSALTGYRKTTDLEEEDRRLDLGGAMAISGAAFSSNMGASDLGHFRFALALFNVRLGYWIPNPRYQSRVTKLLKENDWPPSPGSRFLMNEMFGQMDEKSQFLNLSDGGHIENLGVYELLRRRCKFIVAVDGECDPNRVFDGLVKLERYARIDLSASIEIDLEDLALDENSNSRAHSVLGTINYGDGDRGWLLYIKLTTTGTEPLAIREYRKAAPSFPHQTTLDQIYSERQFDAYRELGRHAASEVLSDDVLGAHSPEFLAESKGGKTPISQWFQALAMSLLPGDHPVFRSHWTPLVGLTVGISASNTKENQSDAEAVNELTLDLAKDLLSKGSQIVSGHDWRPGGILLNIAEEARRDNLLRDRKDGKRLIAVAKACADNPMPPEWTDEVLKVEPLPGDSMRETLAKYSQARICAGGECVHSNKKMSGVLEEAWRSRETHAVLVVPTLGGAAAWLASYLRGQPDSANEPKWDQEGDLPVTAKKLGKAIRDELQKAPLEEYQLHQRLWECTQPEAARAIIQEILRLVRLRTL